MTGLALLLLLPLSGVAQTLTGGGFEMRKHGMGPVAQGSFDMAGSCWTFSGGARAMASAKYPLVEAGGKELMPTPGGFLMYLTALNNQMSQDAVRVAVSKESVPEDFDFFINTNPEAFPMRVAPGAIAQANLRISQTVGPQAAVVPGGIVEFNLLQETGAFLDSNLNHLASITLSYQDADNNGIVDGTNPPIRASALKMYVLDENRRLWVRLPSSSVDRAARTVTAPTPHFSTYALIGDADREVDAVHPFPVPWAPNSGDPSNGTKAGGITFTNLPSEGTIKIYTLSGALVRSLHITSVLFPAQLRWDVRNESGADVVSGVYLWRIESGRNSKAGKLVVIR